MQPEAPFNELCDLLAIVDLYPEIYAGDRIRTGRNSHRDMSVLMVTDKRHEIMFSEGLADKGLDAAARKLLPAARKLVRGK